MPDVFTKAKRSKVMSLIRGRGNKNTEIALAKLLRANGISGWRRHVRVAVEGRKSKVEGKHTSPRPSPQRGEGNVISGSRHSSLVPRLTVRPDFVFLKSRMAVFVDGCFWHSCPKHKTKPKNNRAFWRRKLAGNQKRDQLVNQTLRRAGWRVLRIWECALQKHPQTCIHRIEQCLNPKN